MKAVQFDIFEPNGKAKVIAPSEKQMAGLGPACVKALWKYHKSRTRISEEERAARKRTYHDGRIELIRAEMVAAYGGACVKCGEADPIVLVLDHIKDDAALDRRKHKQNGGFMMYVRLRKAGWPRDRYQLLCHNCNYRKEMDRRKRKCLPRA